MAPLLDHPDKVMFLDIETTGLSRHYDYITAIGFEMDGRYGVWIAGDDPESFCSALARARSIVTFNGALFDLPFIDDAFPGLRWPAHHVDLRYACRRVGLTGGQKRIENLLEIKCREGMEGVDGAMAVLLWHRYLRGEVEALDQLVSYNRADVRSMAHILDHVIKELMPWDLLTHTWQVHSFRDAASDTTTGFEYGTRSAPKHLRPEVSFQSLFGGTPAATATIVGLDLTGSEKRLTGMCILRGNRVETTTIATDDEIIDQVVAARPDLVSIDSPLCLPAGRTTVFDDDPQRHLGIMRICERILKRRGINVYPCLLPSMQRLTARGISIAGRLREHGIPTIECYPGAAQDIMGIPRKGAGEEWLKLGMSEFGVHGPFETERVTHDELDAITCSIVGVFHVAGMTEGLAGEEEEPMIIPRLDASGTQVIGLSGEIMSGKTSTARILERAGYAYTRISEVIDDVIRERGEVPSRESRQRVGLELHSHPGQRWLCRKTIERVPAGTPRIVVDGLRWTEDVDYLRERFGGGFKHVHVKAPSATRSNRARNASLVEELHWAVEHPVESGIAGLESVADEVLTNDGTLEMLCERLSRFVQMEA
ncbi:MAG TPA: ribonuclease H-like domain-containing protein [Sphingopyxis sp.]|uniref:ribonuclease H-like domain-containing protein n=1 Tax=Sphingopyxis sp. TaxID=1908224 RepID=UPI002C1CEDB4|nr:ribonuclease H-like domain-containing protein [Sphingopyxis sp.]HWW58154.1 ribonuclease H-like domain-containing protein [Sphingopyxis sp.]